MNAPIERALGTLRKNRYDNRPVRDRVREFLGDLHHPEQFGHAVTAEVRQRARELAEEMDKEATP